MIELSNERVEQMLHNETLKTEELATILRGIYCRYVRLYEKFFADIDALNDDVIADLKKYQEETRSLMKYYRMDIPQDVCKALNEFDSKYNSVLLGPDWHENLFESYSKFCAENEDEEKSGKRLKAEFSEQVLIAFYEAMDSVFRVGFGTGSKTVENVVSGLTNFFFGGKKEKD